MDTYLFITWFSTFVVVCAVWVYRGNRGILDKDDITLGVSAIVTAPLLLWVVILIMVLISKFVALISGALISKLNRPKKESE